jgi:hypothetical protein
MKPLSKVPKIRLRQKEKIKILKRWMVSVLSGAGPESQQKAGIRNPE